MADKDVVPVAEPTPPAPTKSTLPKWLGYVILVGLFLVGSAGTCTQKFGPLFPVTPAPVTPTPTPVIDGPPPVPGPVPPPSSTAKMAWVPLEAPSKNELDSIALPKPWEVTATQRYVTVQAKCNNQVQWLVSSQTGKQLEVLKCEPLNSIMIFPAVGTDDSIIVMAYTSANDKPTPPAITLIKVVAGNKPEPRPDPKPEPEPKPEPKPEPVRFEHAHVTFIIDKAKQTRAVSDVLLSQDLRKWLKDNGHELHEVNYDPAVLKTWKLDTYLEGRRPPVVVIQGLSDTKELNGKFLDVGPVTSVQQIKDLVNKALDK